MWRPPLPRPDPYHSVLEYPLTGTGHTGPVLPESPVSSSYRPVIPDGITVRYYRVGKLFLPPGNHEVPDPCGDPPYRDRIHTTVCFGACQSRDQENAARKRRVFCDFQTPTTARGGVLNGVICTRAERVSPFFNKTRPTPESNGQKRH